MWYSKGNDSFLDLCSCLQFLNKYFCVYDVCMYLCMRMYIYYCVCGHQRVALSAIPHLLTSTWVLETQTLKASGMCGKCFITEPSLKKYHLFCCVYECARYSMPV